MSFRINRVSEVTPKYPVYVIRRKLPGFDGIEYMVPGVILTSNDGLQWSNPTCTGSPYCLKGADYLKRLCHNGDIEELGTFLADSLHMAWDVTG